MSLNERTREWIHKPVFHHVPVSAAKIYLQGRLEKFRKEHKEFDEFLIGIGELLKSDYDPYLKNIKKFINGETETNWISPQGGLFDVCIKLYNLCLSPEQAFEYIKKCLTLYKQMLSTKYQIWTRVETSIRRSNWDGRKGKFISFSVEPKIQPDKPDYIYWFDITTSLKIIEDDCNDIRTHIDEFKLRCRHEMLEDTLMFFEYYQYNRLLRKVFNSAIKELVSKRIIKEVSQEEFCGWIIHQYETRLKITK